MDVSSAVKVKFLCVISILMSLIFYLYWFYIGDVYSSYTVQLITSGNSIEWFSVPSWVYDFWVPIAIVIYIFLFFGWTIFRHALLLYIMAGLVLSFSDESTCYTSIDILVLDLWKFSDAILLYLLYFDSEIKGGV